MGNPLVPKGLNVSKMLFTASYRHRFIIICSGNSWFPNNSSKYSNCYLIKISAFSYTAII